MSKITVTKRFTFAAAHCLHNFNLTPEKNRELFGACSGVRDGHSEDNLLKHGHNYTLEVTIRAEGGLDPQTGMVINFTDLKEIVKKVVIEKFDHRDIVREVSPFRRADTSRARTATAENMLVVMGRDLNAAFWSRFGSEIRLVKLKLFETEGSWAEWESSDEF